MRSYRQYCGLARALDVVGDRWTLLVIRELLEGPRRYAELLDGLPGIATNLLLNGCVRSRRTASSSAGPMAATCSPRGGRVSTTSSTRSAGGPPL